MQRATPRTDQERPEIQSLASSKGVEYDQVQLNGVSPGNGGARSKYTIFNGIVRQGTCDAARLALDQVEHCRELQDRSDPHAWEQQFVSPGHKEKWQLGGAIKENTIK